MIRCLSASCGSLVLVLCLLPSQAWAQDCEDLKQESDASLVEFSEKELDRLVANSKKDHILAIRAEHGNDALLATELAAVDASNQDKKQAANQASTAYQRALAAWKESCAESGG